MARSNSRKSTDSGSVKLKDPSGNEVEVSTPTSFVNLVYGGSYVPVSGSVDENYAKLVNKVSEDAPGPAPLISE